MSIRDIEDSSETNIMGSQLKPIVFEVVFCLGNDVLMVSLNDVALDCLFQNLDVTNNVL